MQIHQRFARPTSIGIFGPKQSTGRLGFHDAGPVPAPTTTVTLTELDLLALKIGYDETYRPGWERSLSSCVAVSPPFFSRLLSMLRTLTGARGILPLANERLDMLRLLAGVVRRGDDRVGELMDRLLALGMSRTALSEAIDRVTLAARNGATSLRAGVRMPWTTSDPTTSAPDALIECASVDF